MTGKRSRSTGPLRESGISAPDPGASTSIRSRTSAWFGDLKDGVHKGDEKDPRVSLIEVIPDEIRYWYVTRGKVGRAVEIGVGAVTGKTVSPGELRTITKQEVRAFHEFRDAWRFDERLFVSRSSLLKGLTST